MSEEPLPPVVFLLSSPRSGSTLLRVMLEGHSGLFSPPELNLLPYRTMHEWNHGLKQLATATCDQREGLQEAIMTLQHLDRHQSALWLQRLRNNHVSVRQIYTLLRQEAKPRMLVDKSPLNASCQEVLERAPSIDPNAYYIHLVRHPLPVVQSLMRSYFEQLNLDYAFSLSEQIWTSTNTNILRFLQHIDRMRQYQVKYEELVQDSERTLCELMYFLNLPFESTLLTPYDGGRMTGGVRGDGNFIGDKNFSQYQSIDASLAEQWKKSHVPFSLRPATEQLANDLGYKLPPAHGPDVGDPCKTENQRVRIKFSFRP